MQENSVMEDAAAVADFNQCSGFKVHLQVNFVKFFHYSSQGERHYETVRILRRAPGFDFASKG